MKEEPHLSSAQASTLYFRQRAGESLRSASAVFEDAALFCFSSISSTMDAASCYQAGALEAALRDAWLPGSGSDSPSLAVFLAETQTAGRGRGEREWISTPLSGIYVNYLWIPNAEGAEPAPSLAGFSLALGLAVQRSLSELAIPAALKWPNDVLAREPKGRALKKISGILTEATSNGKGTSSASAGIGLNLRASAYPESVPAISIEELSDSPPEYFEVFGLLSRRVAEYASRYFEHGFASMKEEWWNASLMSGVAIRAEGTEGSLLARGLADDGGLLVVDSRGSERVVYSGEIQIPSFSQA